ncbi:MAG: hypothetical protein U1F43_27355 [Myxococcota bacterium]
MPCPRVTHLFSRGRRPRLGRACSPSRRPRVAAPPAPELRLVGDAATPTPIGLSGRVRAHASLIGASDFLTDRDGTPFASTRRSTPSSACASTTRRCWARAARSSSWPTSTTSPAASRRRPGGRPTASPRPTPPTPTSTSCAPRPPASRSASHRAARRHHLHWGLGLLANDGAHGWAPGNALFSDPRGGDRVLRALVATGPHGDLGALAFAAVDEVLGDDVLILGDTAWQAVGGVLLGRPDAAAQVGLYGVYRAQEAKDGDRTRVAVVDVYAKVAGKTSDLTLSAELEGAVITGSTDLAPTADHPTHDVLSAGLALRLALTACLGGAALDVLLASGDAAWDDTQSGFKADRNFDLGLLLNDVVLAARSARTPIRAADPALVGVPSEDLDRLPTRGSATNTVSFFPRGWWRPVDGVEVYGGLLVALWPATSPTPSTRAIGGGGPRNGASGEARPARRHRARRRRALLGAPLGHAPRARPRGRRAPGQRPHRPGPGEDPIWRPRLHHLRAVTPREETSMTLLRSTASLASLALIATLALAPACGTPEGIARGRAAKTTVKLDFFAKPLPEIPLPNDLATRYDETSPTHRRVNASLVAPTGFEVETRALLDQLDGWGVLQGIAIPFTGPIDPQSILAGHSDDTYDPSDDVIYLINVDRDSAGFGTLVPLDLGQGNYPVIIEDHSRYWPNDPREWTQALAFEEEDEDTNGNGVLDPGEDTDADGVLDHANYLPGRTPAKDDPTGRADALMTFYEKQTHTVIARPLIPLDERTTYAVVVTRRLLDADGEPVGSPYEFVNHTAQTDALAPLGGILASHPELGIGLSDVAFAWTYTTQSITADWVSVRDGLYGHGVQAHLGQDYPAELGGLETLRDLSNPIFAGATNPYIVYQEDWAEAFKIVATQLLGVGGGMMADLLLANGKYVDFHVIGWYDSPQLFPRRDAEGRLLPMAAQHWPSDLQRTPAETRSERVYFHLMVPRKEISARGQGKPAPLVIIGHGYTSNRFDLMTIGGYLVRHGLAVIAIDCVSHGVVLEPDQLAQAEQIIGIFGLAPFLRAIVERDRALDLNGDGVDDSGGDFWTAYLFHTRDNVRQSALDYMQLVRIIGSFDGNNKWHIPEYDKSGFPQIAGDFDGDGQIDIGGDAPISMLGASLGGIMAAVIAGVEPKIGTSVPIAAGGGMADVSPRSIQGGVREAIVLRVIGPLYLGTGTAESGLAIDTIVPDVNDSQTVRLGTIADVAAGDFFVVSNGRNGERGCGWVRDDAGTLRVRAPLPSDAGDPTTVEVWAGDAMLLGSHDCEVKPGATLRGRMTGFGQDATFQGHRYLKGDRLVALAEGAGLQRGTPDLRRMFALGQMILDRADPAVMAQYIGRKSIVYPGTGESTGHGRTLLVTSVGDMNVPAATGMTIARAAGLLDYQTPLAGHDVSPNQVLIDTHTTEGTEWARRYLTPAGEPVLMDVENFSRGGDLWGSDVPRLDPPLHPGLGEGPFNADGGYSAAIFPYAIPTGQHGFPFPGDLPDRKKAACVAACTSGDCGCDSVTTFDTGSFLFNMFGHYLATDGRELSTDLCLSRNDCAFLVPPPDERPAGR